MNRPIRMVLALVIGAIATCVIALAVSLRGQPQATSTTGAITELRSFGLLAVADAPLAAPGPDGTSSRVPAFTLLAGWPAKAFLATTNPRARAPIGGYAPSQLPWLEPLAARRASPIWVPRVIPATPIWSGIAIDVALHGALAYLALAGVSSAIARGRLRRGLCPRCRYTLRSPSTRCPECGVELAGRARSAVGS